MDTQGGLSINLLFLNKLLRRMASDKKICCVPIKIHNDKNAFSACQGSAHQSSREKQNCCIKRNTTIKYIHTEMKITFLPAVRRVFPRLTQIFVLLQWYSRDIFKLNVLLKECETYRIPGRNSRHMHRLLRK